MDETSGSTVTDVMAGVEATFNGAGITHSLDGATQGEKSSTAISFHTHPLELPNHASLKPAGAFSVEMWVKYPVMEVPADHHLYTFHTAGTASGFQLSMVSGVLTAKYKPSGAATVTLTPTVPGYGHVFDGEWHHVVFASTSNNKVLYVDGVAISTDTNNNGHVSWPATPDEAFLVSGAPSNNPALLDEVAFYSYALSSNQVKNHLSYGDHFVRNQALFPANSIKQARPLGYWRFGEANTYLFQDSSGNQNDIQSSTSLYRMSGSGTGVYARPGGSGLDLNASSSRSNGTAFGSSRLVNKEQINELIGDKFSFSTWINFTSHSSGYTSLFFNHNGSAQTIRFGGIVENGVIKVYFDGGITPLFNGVQTTSPVVPGAASTYLPLTWYHIAITYDGSFSNENRVKVFVNGSFVKTQAIGSIPSNLGAHLGNNIWEFHSATYNGTNSAITNNDYLRDEPALWTRTLSAQEIRAQANESSLRYCEIPVLTAGFDPANLRPFHYLNILFNGTTFDLNHNTNHICSLRPQVNFSQQAYDIVFGQQTTGFEGLISDLRVHGDSSNPIAGQELANMSFYQTLDQHRPIKIGQIVTDKLVKAFEASSASDGVRPYNPGCSSETKNWADIGTPSIGYRQETGTLINFSGCTNTGWSGNGTSNDPYRLVFDGINDWIDLGSSTFLTETPNQLSICAWTRTSLGAVDVPIVARSGSGYGDFYFGTVTGRPWFGFNGSGPQASVGDGTLYRNGQWHYLCGTYDGANRLMYLDGRVVGGPTATTGNIQEVSNQTRRMAIGRTVGWTHGTLGSGTYFQGDIGAVHIYNKGLTAQEVLQNCNAQAVNYGATCSP